MDFEPKLLSTLGIDPSWSPEDVAIHVAKRAGFRQPRQEITIDLLTRIVKCTQTSLLDSQVKYLDRAEAAESVLGCAYESLQPDDWSTCAHDLGVPILDDALRAWVARDVAPNLAAAGLFDLEPPPGDPLDKMTR